jgi:hypothetical protein
MRCDLKTSGIARAEYRRQALERSIGEVLVSILVQFEIGEFELTDKEPPVHEPVDLSEFPLIEKANEWGVTVRTDRRMCKCHGQYHKTLREIQLVSVDVKSFLHGLAHVAIEKLDESITNDSGPWHEIISELAAVALYEIIMNGPDDRLCYSFLFIRSNAVALSRTTLDACLEIFAETEEVIEFILG